MKRSEVNRRIRDAIEFFHQHQFVLPPFAYWTPDQWRTKGVEADAIRRNGLGWDLTDFGSGDFDRIGLLLFTLRNGSQSDPDQDKPYAEKIMVVQEEQVTPMHFHWSKVEDIINRGGGRLQIELYNATDNEELDRERPVVVYMDGVRYTFPPGHVVTLSPGESITLTRRLYHKFWGEKGFGRVLVGEVSSVNDDNSDNRFLEPAGRFPAVEEDEPVAYLLCTEYPSAQHPANHNTR